MSVFKKVRAAVKAARQMVASEQKKVLTEQEMNDRLNSADEQWEKSQSYDRRYHLLTQKVRDPQGQVWVQRWDHQWAIQGSPESKQPQGAFDWDQNEINALLTPQAKPSEGLASTTPKK